MEKNKIYIYSLTECSYCDDLKNKLDGADIPFVNIDIEEHPKEFMKVISLTKEETVPTVVIGKNVLVPNKSFKTIDQAFKIINTLNNTP